MIGDPYTDAADLAELRDRLARGAKLSRLTILTVVCPHQRALVRVVRLRGHDCALYVPREGAKNIIDAHLEDWQPEYAGERLLRLDTWSSPLLPVNDCCAAETIDVAKLREVVHGGARRAASSDVR
ncbi:MAG: hypothetical protein U0R76_07485 [Candidatus Nanopelagicales bacterium]